MKSLLIIVFSLCAVAFAAQLDFGVTQYPELEEIQSAIVDQFVQSQNTETLENLESHSNFNAIRTYLKNHIQDSKNRAKSKAKIYGNYAYGFYTDDSHPNGLYRKVDKDLYLKAKQENSVEALPWENILDVDAFIKTNTFPKEITSPSLGSFNCWRHKKTNEPLRCLVGFSQSGGDKKVFYEFDIQKKMWVLNNSFNFLFHTRTTFTWIDENHLVVGLDGLSFYNLSHPTNPINLESAIEMGLVTKIGYPRHLYVWKRGEPFSAEQKPLFSTQKDAITVAAGAIESQKVVTDPIHFLMVYEVISREVLNIHILQDHQSTGKYTSTPLQLPKQLHLLGTTDSDDLIIKTEEDWATFKKDDVISIHVDYQNNQVIQRDPTLIYRHESTDSILGGGSLVTNDKSKKEDDQIFLKISKNVSDELKVLQWKSGHWTPKEFKIPEQSEFRSLTVVSEPSENHLRLFVSTHLEPYKEYTVRSENNSYSFELVDTDVKIFNPAQFKVSQLWIDQGSDQNGQHIRVPYFIVYDPQKVNLENNEKPAPTLVYGYGGFGVSMNPGYIGNVGHLWLQKGGVYVVANIRGGREFGKYWHESSLKENKSNSYRDFIGVAEDLIRRGITSPSKLAIQGGSNGGLLVGVAMTQRPELFKAVICEIPLLDMARYHKLLSGPSWMPEYGDPETTEKNFWAQYSPLHQLKEGVKYPAVFIKTNRHDDRVHPGHARKFSARLKELQSRHYFYEDPKGGHGGTLMTSDEQAYRDTLSWIYLYKELDVK